MKDPVARIKQLTLRERCYFTTGELNSLLDEYAPMITQNQISSLWLLMQALVNLGYIKGQEHQKYLYSKRNKTKTPARDRQVTQGHGRNK